MNLCPSLVFIDVQSTSCAPVCTGEICQGSIRVDGKEYMPFQRGVYVLLIDNVKGEIHIEIFVYLCIQ